MTITTCDVCGTEIPGRFMSGDRSFSVSINKWPRAKERMIIRISVGGPCDLCLECISSAISFGSIVIPIVKVV